MTLDLIRSRNRRFEMGGVMRSFVLGMLIVTAAVCLVLGLTLPIMRLTRFYVWSDVHSLLSIITELYNAQEIFLAGVICLFSVVFPFVKLLYLLIIYATRQVDPRRQNSLLRQLAWLGKWSMLDVLVLALIIFYAKSTGLADAVSMPGIYMFAAAVILTMLAYGIVEHEVEMPRDLRPEEDQGDRMAIDVRHTALQPILGASRVKVKDAA